ncbi:hypothetical protein SAMN06269250_5906 [Spirosoma fluviale]|uniref:Uncharacterized protein n=1 Tax=Spirosoma fluviale TaxID=1597977 RepID=A0A286GQC4_9BACT|nr:hypothetical protein SAMN06269250_5906 [Spirosoma fluviale]
MNVSSSQGGAFLRDNDFTICLIQLVAYVGQTPTSRITVSYVVYIVNLYRELLMSYGFDLTMW